MSTLESLKRLYRRTIIEDGLIKGESKSAIIQTVRDREEASNLEEVFQQLISQEFYIDIESQEIAAQLSAHLNNLFPDYKIAIILVGSSVHGGKQLKDIFLGNYTSDFDCMLGIEPRRNDVLINQDIINLIDNETELFLKRKNIDLCENMRPKNFALPPFADAQNQRIMLLSSIDEKLAQNVDLEVIYFYPSFPPEFNKRNRQTVLELLRITYEASPYLWKMQVKRMLREWALTHRIQVKYIRSEKYGNIKSNMLAKKIKSESMFRMLELFEKILLSTGDPNTQIDLS